VDSAGNAISYWNWNFGDGLNSTAQNPSHTYTTAALSPSRFLRLIILAKRFAAPALLPISAAQAAQVQFSYTTTNGTITITAHRFGRRVDHSQFDQ